ncbi:hypothetical protein [Rickettsia endosymbiont of Orchestes rusci]|uniref:hypothetical protein n=1 Tax=Rickettsia endosymbiont of Orchestes rusci TaxID=3066250 RepID=UPI00313BA25A
MNITELGVGYDEHRVLSPRGLTTGSRKIKYWIPWSSPLLYERLNKEVKILSFRGYDHGIQLIIS